MKKNNIYNELVHSGRDLVIKNGPEFLTARKLSDASGISVGTIYNQFFNMDNFIIVQNILTLDELIKKIKNTAISNNSYQNLNAYIDVFTSYVLQNSNLWFLLYSFHLQNKSNPMPFTYLRKMVEITHLINKEFKKLFGFLPQKERRLSVQVLWLALFSMSAFLSNSGLDDLALVNKKTISKLLLNTYLAGIRSLKRT